MNDDEDDYIPGLHDPLSVPSEVRIAKYAAYLSEFCDLDFAIQLAAESQIAMYDFRPSLNAVILKLLKVERFLKSLPDTLEAASLCAEIGAINTENLMTVSKENINRKINLSNAGTKGAVTKHAGFRELKAWALEKAKTMRCSQQQIALKLSFDLPDHLKNVSKDPKRLIYEALRLSKKL